VSDPIEYGDPLSQAFWEAASRRELVVQRCAVCASYQFYPRPMCLGCGATSLEWRPVTGGATVYAATTVRLQIDPGLPAPYVVALVDLDEGPRLLTNIDGEVSIGDRVQVTWRERGDAPPLPIFAPTT
jgi:uncharacterized OB-fold protein